MFMCFSRAALIAFHKIKITSALALSIIHFIFVFFLPSEALSRKSVGDVSLLALNYFSARQIPPWNTRAHFISIQGVHLIGQEQRQLDSRVSGIQQVHRISGSRGLMRGVRGQGRRGAAGQVRLPGVAEGEGERRRRSSGWPRGAAGQELAQSSLEVSHEQRVDDGIHGAVAVAQPGDGVKEGEGDTLTHSLSKDRRFSLQNFL